MYVYVYIYIYNMKYKQFVQIYMLTFTVSCILMLCFGVS